MDHSMDDAAGAAPGPAKPASLCFIVDPDFGFLRGFSRSLRSVGIDTVELIHSTRLAEKVDSQAPDIIFLDLDAAHPSECARALMALRECRFAGRIQLFGRCKLALLEDFRKLGSDVSLTMLPVLQKPVDFASIQKIVLEQQLNCAAVAPPGLSLQTALAHGQVAFWYQPKIDMRKRQVIGAEAFARIDHPQHGILPPARFLAGAADEDILDLARQALVSALELSARFDELGISLQFAVNLSVEAVLKLPIADIVGKYRPANEGWAGIMLDVAEPQVISKITVLRDKLQELAPYGVSLSVDNFGRANSSFAMFRYLPFSEIKIDTSFVQGCSSNKGNSNVCKSMIQLAHIFSRHAAAVGVETAEDAKELANLDCDIAQGYVFGKPMRDRHLMTMVAAGRAQSANFCNTTLWDVSPPRVARSG
jgi:EAL domain-containing protein (putative c-di-GMP-specific phosphodiesterase class I)/ActR/RegA family two-component response regulator